MGTRNVAGLYMRAGSWTLRIVTPKDLLPTVGREVWYRKSLGTAHKPTAEALALQVWADAKAEFLRLRSALLPAAAAFTPLTSAMTAYIVGQASRSVLAADDVFRFEPGALVSLLRSLEPTPTRFFTTSGDRPLPIPDYLQQSPDGALTLAQLERLRSLQDLSVADLGDAVARGRLDEARKFAEATCASMGLSVDWSLPSHRMALVAILRALLEAWIDAADRSRGMPVATPPMPVVPEVAVGKTDGADTVHYRTIRDLLPLWKQKTTPTERAVKDTERALDLLEVSGVSHQLQGLAFAHGAAFRDWLRDSAARGFAQKTGLNIYRSITALLNAGPEYGAIPANPWRGLKWRASSSVSGKTTFSVAGWTGMNVVGLVGHGLGSSGCLSLSLDD